MDSNLHSSLAAYEVAAINRISVSGLPPETADVLCGFLQQCGLSSSSSRTDDDGFPDTVLDEDD